MGTRIWLMGLVWLMAAPAWCNNLQLGELSMPGNQQLSFSISWQNSWNRENMSAFPTNYDAVWLFVKVKEADGTWKHYSLDTSAVVHQVDSPLVVLPEPDATGAFIRRQYIGFGNLDSLNVTLQLKDAIPTDAIAIKVFGVEMVWVEPGPFYLGDGASFSRLAKGDDNGSFYITSEQSIGVGLGANQLSDTLGDYAPQASIPAAYPKGYDGFYCMKYELSQEQYVDFLNTLTYQQQEARTAVSPDAASGTAAMTTFALNRNGIRIGTPGAAAQRPAIYVCDDNTTDAPNEATDGQTRACNYLMWADLAAYLDWAALRPMTEFEFEKAARGYNAPVANEYAWGNALVEDANMIINDGSVDEGDNTNVTPPAGLASHGYNGPQGPLRCGFAYAPDTHSQRNGASFFGVFELSGNLWEQCINTTTSGLQYTGQWGDGTLDAQGNANASNWPFTDATGMGFRGGGWNSGVGLGFNDLGVSDRFYITLKPAARRNTAGGRGVR